MEFRGSYSNLQKGRWFFTVWTSLPSESKKTIQENLAPFKPYCEWISTMADNHSKDTPHITLRYLGFCDELSIEEVKKDTKKFKSAINDVTNLDIEVGEVGLWVKETEGKIVSARLNWKITDPKPFIELHRSLLKVPNYYYFNNLEGDNYVPHISLGSIDLSDENNLSKVRDYLNIKIFVPQRYVLKDFALNLTSPEYTEVIRL